VWRMTDRRRAPVAHELLTLRALRQWSNRTLN
jgi:hypothetical protein